MAQANGTRHLTVTEFQEWLAAAQPGERIAYAKGALAASIHSAWQAEHSAARKLSALQEATWRASVKGQVYLVQRRIKPGAFEYLAERGGATRGTSNGVRI